MGLFSRIKHSDGLEKREGENLNNGIKNFQNELSNTEDSEKEFEKLGKIVNSVFQKSLNLHYKFTYEDLKFETKEMNLDSNIQNRVDSVCDSMNDMEFDKEKITKEKLMDTSNLVLELINTLSGAPLLEVPEPPKREVEKEEVIEIPEKEEDKLPVPEPPTEELETKEESSKESFTVGESKLPDKKDIKELKKKLKAKPKKIKKEPEKIEEKKSKVVKTKNPKKALKKKTKAKIKKEPEKVTKKKKFKNKKTKSKENISKKTNTKIKPKKKSVSKEKKLPKFKISSTIEKKEEKFKQDLSGIIKNLERNKKEIKEEIGLIGKEQGILEKENKILKRRTKLPAFKTLSGNIDKELTQLSKKKEELEKKEKEVEERLKAVKEMEKKQKELTKQLGKDEMAIKNEKEFIQTKEKVIKKIKKELEKKYKDAAKEIEYLRKEIEDKEDSFLKLQDFYKNRENKLSLEEENLLKEKRRYAKLVSGLITNHLSVAIRDLKGVNEKLRDVEKKNKELDKKLHEQEKRHKDLIKEKDDIKKDMEQKKKLFDETEKDFEKKGPQFEELDKRLKKKEENLQEREKHLITFGQRVKESQNTARKKEQELEIKELELKSIEKDIERLSFNLKNDNLRLNMREKQLDKRISSYEMLKEDIDRNIRREKRAIRKIEEKLNKRGYGVDRKLRKTETEDEKIGDKLGSIYELGHTLKEPTHFKEFKVTHHFPEVEPGSPAILDILRLLNKAQDFINSGRRARSRDVYLEVQRLFEELNEEEKESIYPEILDIFKPKETYKNMYEHPIKSGNENIDELIHRFENTIISGDLSSSQELYSRLQQKYVQLPPEEKEKYYSKIMDLYNKVLEQQVQTGVVS